MSSRQVSLALALASLASLSSLACTSDVGGGTSSETGSETATETSANTSSETGTDTGTETGPLCGVAAGVCCNELEECQVDEDCCDPTTYKCVLEAASTKCIDLAQMCETCVTNCEGQGVPPDVCESSCAQWCSPPP